jgi:hypothetical protein
VRAGRCGRRARRRSEGLEVGEAGGDVLRDDTVADVGQRLVAGALDDVADPDAGSRTVAADLHVEHLARQRLIIGEPKPE